MLFDVILPLQLNRNFTYDIPFDLPANQLIGRRVVVPLGQKKLLTGIILRQHTEPIDENIQIKQALRLMDDYPIVTERQLRLWQWIAEYYMCTLGQVMKAAIPASLKTDKHLRKPKTDNILQAPPFVNPLNEYQLAAQKQIIQQFESKPVVLLHGVTSSGKTEIYINLIEQTLRQGKSVLYMVPEIALTTQLTQRLQRAFPTEMIVYHSRLTDNQRANTYLNLLHLTEPRVIVGVRSAIFLPLDSVGLIIIDEEHDQSYKQQSPAPRYHARNTAIVLAKLLGARTLLGSATPAIETYYNATQGKYGLVSLTHRHGNLPLPHLQIIDQQQHLHRKQMYGHLADPIVYRIREQLQLHKQTIVFRNRRGFAPWIECKQCAYIPKCINCDTNLTLHKQQHILTCHYCGYTIPIPAVCPSCKMPELSECGTGTERIEDEMTDIFPTARIARMDQDTTKQKESHENIINNFASHQTDILIGTQMVSKGLDFDDVSTVVIIGADTLVNQPDFRSAEHAFQMLEQVSGRAGRHEEQGEVMLQTTNPENQIYKFVQTHDYHAFYNQQIAERHDFKYPPFTRIITLNLAHSDSHKVDYAASLLQAQLQAIFTRRCSRVLQPMVSRVNRMYLRQIILKIGATESFSTAKQLIAEQINLLRENKETRMVNIYADIDPM